MECVQGIGTHSQQTKDRGGMEVNFRTPLDLGTSGDTSEYGNEMTEGKVWTILLVWAIVIFILDALGVPL